MLLYTATFLWYVFLKAKEAIMSQSNKDGSFNEPGIVLHKDMMVTKITNSLNDK
jgi:hypothetical protein